MSAAPEQKHVQTASKVRDELVEVVYESMTNFFTQAENGKYTQAIRELVEQGRSCVFISFADLLAFDETLANAIKNHYSRFEKAIVQAASAIGNRLFTEINSFLPVHDTIDAVGFFDLPENETVRSLRCEQIGSLTSFYGTITRTSEVRPELVVGRFVCLDCGLETEGIPQQFKYTQPVKCKGSGCSNTAHWRFLVDKSVFTDWQKVKVQECSNEIPSGSLPRTIDVVLRGELVETVRAGQTCTFVGTLIAAPDTTRISVGRNVTVVHKTERKKPGELEQGVQGLKELGVRELVYKLSFLCGCVQHSQTSKMQETDQPLTEDELQRVLAIGRRATLFDDMVHSFAPNIFGHDNIKKGVLLLLFGGVQKKTRQGITLRGDINVCIVGDPSTAKSQFLKCVTSIHPRSVYTSGKASSSAGLTAAVLKDPETGDFNIEAGALMLADNGVCCIDEFDKMDYFNQVALHEAMEQQTISIAKGGLHATLNARAAVLAAANPYAGRYDKNKSLKFNMHLNDALMSRFDLFFVVLDLPDAENDRLIAQHIVNVHKLRLKALTPPISSADIKLYIRHAKTIFPVMLPETKERLIETYVNIRQAEQTSANGHAYRMTVRQLESLIRLSEAIARLHLDTKVRLEHVDLAKRLFDQSLHFVETEDDVPGPESQTYADYIREMY